MDCVNKLLDKSTITTYVWNEERKYFQLLDKEEICLIEHKDLSTNESSLLLKLSDKHINFFDKNYIEFLNKLEKRYKMIEDEFERYSSKVRVNRNKKLFVKIFDLIFVCARFEEVVRDLGLDYLNKDYTGHTLKFNIEENGEKPFKTNLIVRTIKDQLRKEQYEQLEEENTFYNGIIEHFKLKNNGEVTSIGEHPVKVYRQVFRGNSIEDRLKLSLGGYSEYVYDKSFIKNLQMKLEQEGEESKLIYHGGGVLFVYVKDLLAVINKTNKVLIEKGIDIVEDYWHIVKVGG